MPIEASSFAQTFKRLEPKAIKDAESRDASYYRLAESPEWKEFVKDIESLKEGLNSEVNFEKAKDVTEFGYMVLARDLTITYLNRVVSMVEQSRDYLKEEENGQ